MTFAELIDINCFGLHAKFNERNLCEAIKWMQEKGLLVDKCSCLLCSFQMSLQKKANSKDEMAWRCLNECCQTTLSVRHGSFFEGCDISLIQCMRIMYCWAREYPFCSIVNECSISESTAIKWCEFIREICRVDLLHNSPPIGGCGHTVVIDEVVTRKKRQKEKGRKTAVPEQWVFGGIDRQTKRCFLRFVQSTDSDALEKIILEKIERGTEILSNQSGMNKRLSNLGYTCSPTANSSKKSATSSPMYHRDVKNLWLAFQIRLKRISETEMDPALISTHLDEFLWRRNRPEGHVLSDLLQAICLQYKF